MPTPKDLPDHEPDISDPGSSHDAIAVVKRGDLDTRPAAIPERGASPPARLTGYVVQLNLPLIGVLLFLTLVLGAIGFGLRPGTDRPPFVPLSDITLYVYQQGSLAAPYPSPATVFVDETLMQETPSVVELQLDVYAEFSEPGIAIWHMLTSISQAQPRSCPDPYHYLGTAYGNPVDSQNVPATVMDRPVTAAVLAGLVGRRVHKTASDVLGLAGNSAASVMPGEREPLALVNLCWTSDAPLAFQGEYASAAFPTIDVVPERNGPPPAVELVRSLYFENKLENVQPVTSEYSLQAGPPFTSSDPLGWHWEGDPSTQIQLTALNIPVSQHESYLGFVSGVLFGVAGGAFVSLLQETLAPLRRRRTGRNARAPASAAARGGEAE